jgi:hypothetical protein
MIPPILAKLTSLVQKRRHAERRRAKRLAPGQATPCVVKVPDEDRELPARVQNLSVGGLGVLTTDSLPVNASLQIVLINGPHTYALTVGARVARCFRAVKGDYYLGCQFSKPLTYDELAPFLL